MKQRTIWETREITYDRQYCVVGERLLLDDREGGWYVSSWSNSVHINSYWVAGGRFYQALLHRVTERVIDLEIGREIELDPERARITLEAIDQWKKHSEDRTLAHAAMDESSFHLVAA
jgi:hypothetical protein